jgi:hypothetical protein
MKNMFQKILEQKEVDEPEKVHSQSYAQHPKYVVTSTSLHLEETRVFESDAQGNNLSKEDYGCIAKRLGHEKMWQYRDVAVEFCLPDHVYYPIKDFGVMAGVHQCLFKRFDPELTPEEAAQSAEARRKIFRVF